jgi:hypothetical protein
MWDLWWTKWNWERIFPEYLAFPLSISFRRRSNTWKNEKMIIFLFIFISGLHNKLQGCGTSVASAAGPISTHTHTQRGQCHIKPRILRDLPFHLSFAYYINTSFNTCPFRSHHIYSHRKTLYHSHFLYNTQLSFFFNKHWNYK